MVVERSFRKLIQHTERRAIVKDMKENASILQRKQAFYRFIRVANYLMELKEAKAEEQREKWLALLAVSALRDNLSLAKSKRLKQGKSDVFYSIRLKLTVLRALALHTLQNEKRRLSAQCRVAYSLPIRSKAALKLQSRLSN